MWDHRPNSRKYFYLSRREGRSVRRIYFGPDDEVTRQIAALQEQRQAEREADRVAWLELLRQLQAADVQLTDLKKSLGTLVKACLIQEGFHQHARSHWRKIRN
jgi:hypothetical protein